MTGTKKTARVFALAGVAALALSACGTTGGNNSANAGSGNSSGSGSCGHYEIAYMGALTGPNGALGQNMLGGINTALSEYNAKHADCKVTVKTFDSQGDPDQASKLALNVVNDTKVVGLIGPGFSGESKATGKTFFSAGLPSISPSATEVDLTEQGWTTWHRVIGNDSAQGAADAKYLTGKKVFVVDDASVYGKGLADVVRKGLKPVGNDEVQTGQTDFSATVTKIKGSGADAVFYGGYYAESGLLVKQLRQAGWKGLFMSGDGSEDPAFVKVAGSQAAEGAVLSAPAAPAPADFGTKYASANPGKTAGLYSTQSYDAANIFLAGIDAGDTSLSKMNDFVTNYSGTGVSGPIKFDSKGDIQTSTIYAYSVKNGQLDTANPAPIK
ncbi:branched-chain amino acid ABC transporter substrate-binding protein [Nocardioides sp. Iso805N]|uniref:branched-chain amino acid ABC transporter substrate-binding protein n=1 Tax=Nocardioides sp. Iso805N TaxID=1283287 RepID=UPI00037E1081|nr:branched-chain amino acid ABC transporter substrate-binding protein [Nocardioides sp. Iso805N]